jgi:hypothetical protein
MLIAVDRAEYARCPSGSCTFQYQSGYTPVISRLQHGVGSYEALNFEGYLRVANGVSLSSPFDL